MKDCRWSSASRSAAMPERILVQARNRTVAIEGEVIVEAAGRFDRVLNLPHGDVRPGLINAHDHLHRNHYGRLGRPPYRNAYEWAGDIQVRFRSEIETGRRWPRRSALLAGAWKNLFAGVTTVVHHDLWEQDFDRDFPLKVVRVAYGDSLGMSPDLAGVAADGIASIHLAEGLRASVGGEVRTIKDRGLLGPNLVAVHGVGMEDDEIASFRASGAALAWCPSSNDFLFGQTASTALLAPGTDVLLGSDSLLTGAGNLLDELRVARRTGRLSDRRLEDAVGHTAAHRLGLPPPTLEPGSRADLCVLGRPLLEARTCDVQLVVVGGTVHVAEPDFAPLLGSGTVVATAGVRRWISATKTGPSGEPEQLLEPTHAAGQTADRGVQGHEEASQLI